MKARILKITTLFAIFALALGGGYFLGHRNATNEAVRSNSAGILMFFTGIHQKLAEGDIESAKHIAVGGASCQILAIDNMERYPLLHQFWSMFPYKGMPDTKAMTERNLDQSYAHFSKDSNALMPEAMTYLEKHSNK